MNDSHNPDALNPEVQRKIERIRAALSGEAGQNGGKSNKMILLLKSLLAQEIPVSEEDVETLALIISDIAKGVDVESRYPVFFSRLGSNPGLQEAFLDLLDLLVDQEFDEGEAASLPSPDLSFLSSADAVPVIDLTGGGWRVTWELTARALGALFFPPAGQLVRSSDLLEDPWFVLLRTEIPIDNVNVLLNLEAALDPEDPESLSLQLGLYGTAPGTLPAPSFQAALRWNAYQEERIVPTDRVSPFPGVPLDQVMDLETGAFTGGLMISLTQARN